jgi:predicted Zn-dependent protease
MMIAASVALLALVSSSCATNPVTGTREFMLLSRDDEIAMGKETDPQIIASYGQYEDAVVYGILGYTEQTAFDGRRAAFEQSMKGFRNLTEAARVNVKPDRVALREVVRTAPLRQALLDLGVPQEALEEHAILNGLEPVNTVNASSLLKVVVDY